MGGSWSKRLTTGFAGKTGCRFVFQSKIPTMLLGTHECAYRDLLVGVTHAHTVTWQWIHDQSRPSLGIVVWVLDVEVCIKFRGRALLGRIRNPPNSTLCYLQRSTMRIKRLNIKLCQFRIANEFAAMLCGPLPVLNLRPRRTAPGLFQSSR